MAEKEQKIAIVFPGQGIQRPGMGKDLFDRFLSVQRVYQEANDMLGYDIAQISFYGPMKQLNNTEITQVAIAANMEACFVALQEKRDRHFEVTPNTVFAGQSLGEYLALRFAGAFDFGTMLKLIQARGRGMQEACKINPSGMISIKADPGNHSLFSQLEAYYGFVPTLFNDQIVIGGGEENLDKTLEYLKEADIKRVKLNVAGSFHSKLMKPAVPYLKEALDKTIILPLKNSVIANTTAESLTPFSSVADIENELLAQMILPVQWRKTLQKLHIEGYHIGEVGEHSITPNMLQRLFGGSTEKIILETAAAIGIATLAVIWRHQTHESHK